MKLKSNKKLILTGLVLLISSPFLMNNKIERKNLNSGSLSNERAKIEDDKSDILSLENSWYDNSMTPITIDDDTANNWIWARTQEWCSKGDGSYGNPYIIENCTIDGGGTESGITVKNSDVYFIIKNCTLYNSNYGLFPDFHAGIKFENVANGTIFDTNCSNNANYGIFLATNCDNNTISNNILDNNWNGIGIYSDGDDNVILNNTMKNNQNGVIIWWSNCDNNYIINNTIINTASSGERLGINLNGNCFNSVVSGNNMTGCGISIYGELGDGASHTIFTNNTVNKKPVYYYVGEYGLNSDNFTNAGQIILFNCHQSIIENLNISLGTHGIFLCYSNNNTLRNITANNNRGRGIFVDGSCERNLIYNNSLNDNEYGIYLEHSSQNNTFFNNSINNNIDAIFLSSNCDYNMIFNNTCENNVAGIVLISCNNVTIQNNTIKGGTYGIWLNGGNNFNKIYNNTVSDTLFGIILAISSENNELKGNCVRDNTQYGIHIDDTSNFNKIIENFIGNLKSNAQDIGLYIDDGSSNNTISNNYITSNMQYGIYLRSNTFNNTFSENTVINNTFHGVFITTNSRDNIFIENLIVNNSQHGVYMSNDAHDNIFMRNTIFNNSQYGIFITSIADGNILTGNTIANNSQYGIYLNNWADNNVVTENVIANNSLIGLYIDDGFCEGNLIYLNHFMGNNLHARDNSDPNDNQWDNGTVGNFWDDYGGVDSNNNCIGDTSYSIDGTAGAKDNFPLMCWPLPDIDDDNNDEDDDDITGLTISYGNLYILFIVMSFVALVIIRKSQILK